MARGRRMAGYRWQPRMHQVPRLCIKSNPGHVKYTVNKNTQNARSAAPVHTKWPAVGEWVDIVGHPECPKYCACSSKVTQGINYTVNKNAQNARSAAPVHTKRPAVVEWGGYRWPPSTLNTQLT